MRTSALLLSLVVLCPCLVAHASGPTISTVEHGPWADSIAAVEANPDGDGAVLHVVVSDGDGRKLSCDAYALTLDAVGRAAFEAEPCDAATGATPLHVRARAALFAHDEPVPRPLPVAIDALIVSHASASGGASPTGGSTARCSIEVHPYLVDEEHGTRVPLLAPSYSLRVADARVVAAPTASGWSLGSSATAGTLDISYDVLDARGTTVVTRRALLSCGDEQVAVTPSATSTVGAPADDPPPSDRFELLFMPPIAQATNWGFVSRASLLGYPIAGQVPVDPSFTGSVTSGGVFDIALRFSLSDVVYAAVNVRPLVLLLDSPRTDVIFSELGAGLGVRARFDGWRLFAETDLVARAFWSSGAVLADLDLTVGAEATLDPDAWLGAELQKSVLDPESFNVICYVALRLG